jgi:steroid delta-isomerase-like uncharacterized protein
LIKEVVMTERLEKSFVQDFVRRLGEAINSHDSDAIVALCSQDIVWVDPAAQTPLQGRDAVRRFHRDTFFRAMPDVRYEVVDGPYLSLDGTRVAVRAKFIGTMNGPLDPPGFAPTGRTVEFETAEFWEFDNDLLVRQTVVIDMLALARQIGAAPRSGSLAERVVLLLQRLTARV